MCLFVSFNLLWTRAIWEEVGSTEGLFPSDFLVPNLWWILIFNDWCGRAHCGQCHLWEGWPGLCKKAVMEVMGCKPRQHSSLLSLQASAIGSCLVLAPLDDRPLQSITKWTLPSPKCHLSMVLTTSVET